MTVQPYNEVEKPIKYGFNDKKYIIINGIERVCSVCGWHVDDMATTEINRQRAIEAQNGDKRYAVSPVEVTEPINPVAESITEKSDSDDADDMEIEKIA